MRPTALILVLLSACASPRPQVMRDDQAFPYANADVAPAEAAPSAAADVGQEANPMARAPAAAGRADYERRLPPPSTASVTPAEPGAEPAASPSEPVAGTRLVHYTGYAKLRVSDPEEIANTIIARVEADGGYIEQRRQLQLVVRIPVRAFRAVFAALLKMGDVIDQAMSAQDITDSYSDVKLRLETLRAARSRLAELLAQATHERERLDILNQISQLTEEIDVLQAQLNTLATLAAFSRITIALVPRYVERRTPTDEPIAAFRWIWQLSPFKRDIAQSGKRLELKVPQGMAKLSHRDQFVTESADGAVLWTARRPNEPRGTSEFWQTAIAKRLAPEYAKAETRNLGAFKALHLVDHGDDPYRYLIAVRANGNELELVEVFYPSAKQETRYQPEVAQILEQRGKQ